MKEIAERIKKNLNKTSLLLSSGDNLLKKIDPIKSNNGMVSSWSKTNAFSVIPFYNELTGFKNGSMLDKEPKDKKNVYCYLSDDKGINKVLSYNSKESIEDVSYIIREGNENLEIRESITGDILAISQVILDDKGRPTEAYYANDDDNASGYHYFYDGDVIDKILTVSNNSPLPWVVLSCKYDDKNNIKEIYFENKNGKVNVFPR